VPAASAIIVWPRRTVWQLSQITTIYGGRPSGLCSRMTSARLRKRPTHPAITKSIGARAHKRDCVLNPANYP
jgi:hypothetical protein